jgi:hypothetical protein
MQGAWTCPNHDPKFSLGKRPHPIAWNFLELNRAEGH